MNAALKPAEKSVRIMSVDMLRGLTIFVMIFANYGFLDAPWFMQHYNWNVFSGATYVDYIFSMFLVLVGISIPLAFRKYETNWRSNLKLIWHVLLRSGSMLLIGLLIINSINVAQMPQWGFLEPMWSKMGIAPDSGAVFAWRSLVILGVILLFNQLSINDYRARWASLFMRILGAGIIIYYMIVFRPADVMVLSAEHQESSLLYRIWQSLFCNYGNWLRSSWWEIIGLIGWAYMTCGLLYMLVRKNMEMIYLAMLLLFIFVLCGQYDRFSGVLFLDTYWGFLGKHSLLTMLGVGLGAMMLKAKGSTKEMFGMLSRFLLLMILFCVFTTPWFGLGDNATPSDLAYGSNYQFLFAVNKNACTMGWIFSTGAFCALLWMLFYLLCDVWHMDNFVTKFFCNLGSVPLTAYIYQFLIFALLNTTGLLNVRVNPEYFNMWTSMSVGLGVTLFICLLAIICKRYKFSLKL